ncbi:hypothetical protein [uncultured Enterococcus sp.]|uniref:hypothetical protein n=1 Tax=uncultured Enterococcus sp. TaxID=167972 RepID=UPI002AA7C2BB|nr:hypothetical protein [uncultured Enterococcus sp.]
MKKSWVWGWLILLSLVITQAGCSTILGSKEVSKEEERTYQKNTANLTAIEPEALSELIDQQAEDDELFIYFGRVTCPYCREFVASLHEQKPEQQTVYYLDTEDTQTNEAIRILRETYEVETVPRFIKVTTDGFDTFDTKKGELAEFFSE